MEFQAVANYPGYIYDSGLGEYITPAGRIVDYPGGPFLGTYSKDAFKGIQERFESENEVPVEQISVKLDELTPTSDETYENEYGNTVHKKAYVVGDVTINVVDIT